MDCEFIQDNEDPKRPFKCVHCGFRARREKTTKRCEAQTELNEMPDLFQRGANFVTAAMKHISKGLPKCTDEEVEERYKICESNQCGLFNEEKKVCMHKKCGCFIRQNGKYLDKLRWADSECPVGLWGPVKPKDE